MQVERSQLFEAFGQKTRKQADLVTRHMEYSFMYAARFNEDFPLKISEYRKLLKLGEQGYVMNIEIDSTEEDGLDWKKDEDIYRRSNIFP